MIVLTNICKSYGLQSVIRNFSLTVEDGSFIAITGQSGSGKTTLLNIMGLLEEVDKGRIEIDGKKAFSARDKLLFHRNEAGFLFQNYALIEEKTVRENLKIAMTYNKPEAQEISIHQALDMVGLSSDIERKKILQLSGGEQQRIALARILLKNPKYVFADEPTGNLDDENRDIVFGLLKTLNQQRKTVIIVTHDAKLAMQTQHCVML